MHHSPIRVVLDLEKSRNRCSGLGQFAYHLGRALTTEMTARGLEPVPLVAAAQEHDFETQDTLLAKAWRKEMFQRWYRWTQMITPPDTALWHATHQQARYLPLNSKTKVVLTIHDLNYLREKNGKKIVREHRRIARLIARADAVTVISRFVAEEVQQHFDLGNRPLRVIYNGRPETSQIPAERPTWLSEDRPFLFSIGIIDRKKNFHVLLDLLRNLPGRNLIVAGQNDSDYAIEILRTAAHLGVADRVILPGPVSDEQRQWLYENCESFVFPSLTEGFGLPPIEAMTVGKPVFLARRTSLPEVGGKKAFYWDDFSAEHMLDVYQQGMETFQQVPNYADQLKQSAARFCWRNAARQYVDLYREVLNLPSTLRDEARLAAA
ncbi:glycosyltransferase family 1 protein [Bremerella cremea]|uniref:Glycosyl transferase family 1 n=1 Tax=Blastopirellula marina TaxID=124 RepID=A0A2S8FBJ5_9BACT|nr:MULTISPECIES: glycosyltransferase family 1 protein [Pirellulaceae]PQO29502.1 glycosyl transferase family 1 [Blastopirellula marina]RCS42806.1 glycosyltransferase family 1 protein [Bremerella cremea]